jgi:hypothetical protein
MLKEHLEFFTLDMNSGWEQVPGYPSGIDHKILAGSLDEENRRGSRTPGHTHRHAATFRV